MNMPLAMLEAYIDRLDAIKAEKELMLISALSAVNLKPVDKKIYLNGLLKRMEIKPKEPKIIKKDQLAGIGIRYIPVKSEVVQ